jgi:hypothetical protein
MSRKPRSFGLAVLLVATFSTLSAQTAGTGALTGTVTDSSGAAIPNASVVATSNDTGQSRTGTTTSNGTYRFALLPPGVYKVSISANGFKPVEYPAVTIAVTETPVLNGTLEVGSRTEQITVEATTENIQTATSTLGTTVTSQTVTALPLNTRNYTNLLGLSAGTNASVNNATSLGRGAMDIAVNGATTAQNTYQMDGVSIVNLAGLGTQLEQGPYPTFGIPNPDTLSEFKIQTSLYDAGYGRNPGANVNVITKSGTNQIHGSAFEFFRNTDLNANDFFRNRQGGSPLALSQNQFGGVLGGPIRKDKLFVFGSYQQTWQKNGFAPFGLTTINLPGIPGGPRGNTSLSGVDDAAAAAFRAQLGAAFCHSPTTVGGTQVSCTGSNINPIAMRFLQAQVGDGTYFLPGSGVAGVTKPGVQFSQPAYDKEYQGMLNLDYLINSKNTLASRYYRSYEPQILSFAQGGVLAPGFPITDPFGYHNAVLKLTTIVTNNMVNELRGSAQRTTTDAASDPAPGYNASSIYGTPPGCNLLGCVLPFAPVISLASAGFYQAGGSSQASDLSTHTLQTQIADQVSYTRGKHTFRAGFEYDRDDWNWNYAELSRGIMAFNSFSDFLIGLPGGCGAASATCNGAALSNISNTNNYSIRSGPSGIVHGYRVTNSNWFVQDDWKATQRLTVNLGLRWEYDGNLSDKYGNLSTMWYSALQTVNNPATFPASVATGTPAGWVVPANYSTATYGALLAGVINSGHGIATKTGTPLNNFAPRAGFAWQPTNSNRLSVRGGAGMFYDRVPGNTLVHAVEQNAPYGETLDQSGANNAPASLQNPFFTNLPLGSFPVRWVNFPAVLANPNLAGNLVSSNLTTPTMADTFLTPLMYSWNLNVQYEFLPRWVLEVAYVGSHGIHQPEYFHIANEAALATPATPVNGLTVSTVNNASARVPFLGMAPSGLQVASTDGDIKFNSLQATLRKQLSHGLSFQAAYTFSRAFTNIYAAPAGITGVPNGTNDGDPNNSRQQYGLSGQYRPQRLVINYNYNLPGANLHGAAGAVLGGWSLSGVTTIQDGQPLTAFDNRGASIYGLNSSPNVISRAQMAVGMTNANIVTPGGVEARLGGASGGPGYFNTAAFTAIPLVPGTNGTGWGDSGVGVILGPGQFNFDATLAKVTRVGGIHEGATLQFRAEFFNLFNHPQFNNPGVAFNSPASFGAITSTSVNPRLIQLALKYVF